MRNKYCKSFLLNFLQIFNQVKNQKEFCEKFGFLFAQQFLDRNFNQFLGAQLFYNNQNTPYVSPFLILFSYSLRLSFFHLLFSSSPLHFSLFFPPLISYLTNLISYLFKELRCYLTNFLPFIFNLHHKNLAIPNLKIISLPYIVKNQKQSPMSNSFKFGKAKPSGPYRGQVYIYIYL